MMNNKNMNGVTDQGGGHKRGRRLDVPGGISFMPAFDNHPRYRVCPVLKPPVDVRAYAME
jgi:hypothetical protein